MNIERELKYFFPLSDRGKLIQKLSIFEYVHTKHELNLNYDNPNRDLSFYDMKVDGRLRLRTIRHLDGENAGEINGLLSWKQRIPEHSLSKIRHEHEVKCRISGEELNNIKVILEDVLKCPLVDSYERERTHYHSGDLDITLDRFPYGFMLELEFKSQNYDENELIKVLEKIDLKLEEASLLSCDDMYKKLCREQNKEIKNHILFDDKDMPILS